MESPIHSINSLFAQLGLPSKTEEVDLFIEQHRPLPDHFLLHEAPCWSASQATFLAEEIEDDADWAEVIDELNARLRNPV
ncbi:MAG: hypothetical protein RL703_633 [Pseudomonadota bacterium]|jgi:hypothetical protein